MLRASIYCAFLLLEQSVAHAEEAIDLTGRRQQGQFVREQGSWFFRAGQGKPIALKDLAYIRFEPAAALRPEFPLTKTLLLGDGQRLTGTLLKWDEQSIEFANAPEKRHVLRRDQVVGIVHADDWLPIVHEDFETPLKSWQIQGAATLDPKVCFFGKQSLRLDEAGQRLSRTWPALNEGRISLFCRQAKTTAASLWTIEVLGDADPFATVIIDNDGVHCASVRQSFGTLDLSNGWHGLVIEWQAGVLRFYLDDQCLGQTPMPGAKGIKGIRFSTKKVGDQQSIFIDEMTVARRLPVMPIPKNDAAQDSLWLEHGEQLFGRLVSADARFVVLDAKFGKRTLAWSQLRGIGFAEPKRAATGVEAEIEFRPGSGCSADRLHVKLLRWDEAKLIVQHATLGEMAIERKRLQIIRPEPK